MPIPRFEVPSGAIDDVNTTFVTSVPFQAGTTAVFLNGLLLRDDLIDGWTEIDPDGGIFSMKEAPRSSGACPDVLQVFFIDTSPQLPEEVITGICGTLEVDGAISGTLSPDLALCGAVEIESGVTALVTPEWAMLATVEVEAAISGVLVDCECD